MCQDLGARLSHAQGLSRQSIFSVACAVRDPPIAAAMEFERHAVICWIGFMRKVDHRAEAIVFALPTNSSEYPIQLLRSRNVWWIQSGASMRRTISVGFSARAEAEPTRCRRICFGRPPLVYRRQCF